MRHMLNSSALKKGVSEASVECPKRAILNQCEVKLQGFLMSGKVELSSEISELVPRAGIEPARPIARNPGF